MKKKIFLFSALICIILLTGYFFLSFRYKCGGSFHGGNSKEKKVLRVSIGKRITSLDPALASDSYSQKLVCAIFDTPLQ
ncbi:MAG: hypothetical protein IKC08_00405, partial [Lentisphaeria bacterium]|nr:hypothetical protein [Lentisphaeria bacterium]